MTERHPETDPAKRHIDPEPDKEHGDPVMEQFERSGAEERELDELGEGETQDGPA